LIETIAIAALAILLIVTNIFWAFVCLKFTNRLMSRNFYEFKAADQSRPTKQVPKIVIPETDEYAEAQAKELNSILNIS